MLVRLTSQTIGVVTMAGKKTIDANALIVDALITEGHARADAWRDVYMAQQDLDLTELYGCRPELQEAAIVLLSEAIQIATDLEPDND